MVWGDLTKYLNYRSRIWSYINQLIDNTVWLKDNGGGGGGDMYKEDYDIDDNGIVDAAEALDDGVNSVSAEEVADVVDEVPNKVSKTGDETIAGIKTFSSIPVLPASDPTTDNQAVRKAYVDAHSGGGESIKTVSSDNYTILDNDGYTEIQVTTGASDRTINLPTLADNQSRKITIRKMDSGAGKIIVTPEGAELINDWNATVEITEQYGWWEFTATSGKWITKTDGWSTVYSVSSEVADTGLTLDGTYDDVNGMALGLLGKLGQGILSAKGIQLAADSSLPSNLILYFGLGTIAGNNAPNIAGASNNYVYIQTIANVMSEMKLVQYVVCSYTSDGTKTIYMKARVYSSELDLTIHEMDGATNAPMFIKWRRIR